MGINQTASAAQSGGNMEGKEVRFGIVNSALWATITTDTSCGAVNSMHDSYTPLGGLIPLLNMQIGEIIFGGVGSGLYGMLVMAVLAVFIAGLMVGRTPEYLGKKIEGREMKLAMLFILIFPTVILLPAGVAIVTKAGLAGISNPGPHGFSQILYAYTEASRQQRLGLRRTQRQHAVLQCDARDRDAVRAFHDEGAGARAGRFVGRQAGGSAERRNLSDQRRHLRGSARRP